MAEYILFSPVGGTDPIASMRDGSLLHICRKYRPRHVCLYLSKEIYERHLRDDRYCCCLNRLADEMGFPMEISIEARPELVEVHDFDLFLGEFRTVLQQLHHSFPDDTLLVNISSGTPGMKSALNTLSFLTPFPTTAVQVATPLGKQNRHEEAQDDYDAQAYWDCNFDNDPSEYRDRCLQPQRDNLQHAFISESICRNIEQFDYEAAYREANTIPSFFSPLAMQMLEAAKLRLRLSSKAADKLPMAERGFFRTRQTGARAMLEEYLLWLQLKEKRGDLSDFVRGVTPAIYRLTLGYLEEVAGWRVSDYCVGTSYLTLDIGKLGRDELGQRFLSILNEKYRPYKSGPLNSDTCVTLICASDAPGEVKKCAEALRNFEYSVRNSFAHDICEISPELLEKRGGLKSKDVLSCIKQLAAHLFNPQVEWNSYGKMNERLIQEVKAGAAR